MWCIKTNKLQSKFSIPYKSVFRAERLQSLLEYECQKILILAIDPIQFQLTDSWDVKSVEAANVLIHADVKLQQILAILAMKTVLIFLRMGNRLLALVEEKRITAANATLYKYNQQQLLIPSSETNVSSSEPQLFILSDKMPPLKWVGVQQQKIPGLVDHKSNY
ncbi:8106_t:CDS:2 [Entrophospora sp. SA101]|nr:8106_t:CDS:2 [Entrophospora sp. SA101]